MSVLLSLVNVCAMPFGALDFTSENCHCAKCDNLGLGFVSQTRNNYNTSCNSPDLLRHKLTKGTKWTNELTDKLTTFCVMSEPNLRTVACQTSSLPLSPNKQSCAAKSSPDVIDGLMFTSHQNLSQTDGTFSKDVSALVSSYHRRSFSFPVTSHLTPDLCSDLLKEEKKSEEVTSTDDVTGVEEVVDHIRTIERKIRTDASYSLVRDEEKDIGGELGELLVVERSKFPLVWELPPTPNPPEEEEVEEKENEEERAEDENGPNDLIRIGICLRAMADNYGELQQTYRPDNEVLAVVSSPSFSRTLCKVLGVSLLTLIVWKNYTTLLRPTEYLQSLKQLASSLLKARKAVNALRYHLS